MIINESVFIEKNSCIALKDSKGYSLTYGNLQKFCFDFNNSFRLKGRELVFVLCENTVPAAAFFVACIYNNIVPLLLNGAIDDDMLARYLSIYCPDFIYKPKSRRINYEGSSLSSFPDYELIATNNFGKRGSLYEELSFLLPTSGSTGSPKLVRHSYLNIDANSKNVAKAFDLQGDECAMLTLPIYFTQGLSVMCSHLYAGACVFLTDAPLTTREFWDSMKNEKITSFTGVPYSYEVLDKLRFYTMKLPDLKVISQGGGRLPDELFKKLSSYAGNNGKKFYATYGATETTARMSCLAPEYSDSKCGSIGKPLPGCEMWIEDDLGNEVTVPGEKGEIIFKGDNVTLGYAESADDLAKGDERNGIYRTGDLAYKDEDGFYYITGRLSRFIKIFGFRISLDETERLVKSTFGNDFACVGNDKLLCVFTSDQNVDAHELLLFLKNKLQMNISCFRVNLLDEIPKNSYGKTNYSQLSEIFQNNIKE